MCEFCTQHGEGKKWYFNTKNYATELLNDLERKNLIKHFYRSMVKEGNKNVTRLENILKKNRRIPGVIKRIYTKQLKSAHFGQVLPIEDIFEIFSFSNSIVRLACGCRWEVKKKEKRYCFGISCGPPDWYQDIDMDYFGSPNVAKLESLKKEEAMQCIKELDKKGMVHSVWTFQTPFIGAVCNCERTSCLAMRATIGLEMPGMFRGESVAAIDTEKCSGCQACSKICPFEAIEYSGENKKCFMDIKKCFGCGVCRSICQEKAISLIDRNTNPIASSIW